MKIITTALLCILVLFICYKTYHIAIEGTRFDKPKIFYTEENNAIYTITSDPTTNFYFLEGTNSYPERKQFRIPIIDTDSDLDIYLNKKVSISAEMDYAKNRIPCSNNLQNLCEVRKEFKKNPLYGVRIKALIVVK